MKDERQELYQLLTPTDDGRGFTDAVLLRASGALARRRAAAGSVATPFGWLEHWARPWLVAALVVLAVATLVPALPWTMAERAVSAAEAPTDEMAALLPDDVVTAAAREGR